MPNEESDKSKDAISIDGSPITPLSSNSSSSSMKKGTANSVVNERSSSPKSEKAESQTLLTKTRIVYTSSRPDVEDFIRRPVEATGGETQIAVCGGKSLVACVRNHVAALSDERGVHKGTGAQGIALFTEHYSF